VKSSSTHTEDCVNADNHTDACLMVEDGGDGSIFADLMGGELEPHNSETLTNKTRPAMQGCGEEAVREWE
jgi:hypothetical protein